MTRLCPPRDPAGRRACLVALFGGVVIVAGCTSYGLHLTPRPTPSGRLELGLNADLLVIDRGFGYLPLPQPELSLRYGLDDWVDIGGRVNLLGVAVNSRMLLWQSPGLQLSIVPGLAFGVVPVSNADTGFMHTSGTLDLVAGLPLRSSWDLVFALRSQHQLQYGPAVFEGATGSLKFVTLAGMGLGLRFPVSETFYLFPELGVLVPFDTKRDEWLPPLFQFGFGLEWGR